MPHSLIAMKEIRIVLEDADYSLLDELKNEQEKTWRDLLLAWIKPKRGKKK